MKAAQILGGFFVPGSRITIMLRCVALFSVQNSDQHNSVLRFSQTVIRKILMVGDIVFRSLFCAGKYTT